MGFKNEQNQKLHNGIWNLQHRRDNMDGIMKETGCHPSHWIPPANLPLCTNATEMKNFALQPTTLKVEMYDPPCKIIERLDYSYKEKDDPREFSR